MLSNIDVYAKCLIDEMLVATHRCRINNNKDWEWTETADTGQSDDNTDKPDASLHATDCSFVFSPLSAILDRNWLHIFSYFTTFFHIDKQEELWQYEVSISCLARRNKTD